MTQHNFFKSLSLIKSLPAQLVLCIISAFFLSHILTHWMVCFFYSISLLFVDILLFILPFMVFSFILRALLNLDRGSTWLVGLIFISVTLSNITAVLFSFGYAMGLMKAFNVQHCPGFEATFASSIIPLWQVKMPILIPTDKAMMGGLFIGFIAIFAPKSMDNYRLKLNAIIIIFTDNLTLFLSKTFIPLLPLYIFGFCLKLSYDDALTHLFKHYGHVFFASLFLVCGYLFLMYILGAGGKIKDAWSAIRTMMPAGLTGFSTMSSAATMPITLDATEKNTKDRNFTNLVIPSTTNIHMLGDDLTITVTAVTLLVICGQATPDFFTVIAYALAFSIAKLSCVGIPGASVLVILPVLQQFLGFKPEMISMLTTIYILQDSFGTAANVMGNGAFAMIIQRLYKKLKVFIT